MVLTGYWKFDLYGALSLYGVSISPSSGPESHLCPRIWRTGRLEKEIGGPVAFMLLLHFKIVIKQQMSEP